MHNNIAAVAAIGMAALLGFPAQAQSGLDAPAMAAARSFLPVESRYASAIQEHGLEGFQGETAPGFVIRHGRDRWTGAAASAQADAWMHGVQGGKVAVTIWRVKLTGRTAIVLTRELMTFPPMTVKGQTATMTGTWYWKQTWKRTGQGWRLAVLEPISEKALGPASAIEYTVYADHGSIRIEASSPDPKTS